MHITNRRQYFQDSLTELLGIKCGLGVNIERASKVFGVHAPRWWDGPRELGVRLEATELEEAFSFLLHGVGAIDSPSLGVDQIIAFARKHEFALPSEWDDYGKGHMHPEIAKMMARVTYLQSHIIKHLDGSESLPDDLSANHEFLRVVDQYELRSINHGMPSSSDWDGVVSLEELFGSEAAPTEPEAFFDQRFIDYLSAQPDDLSAIHWRQFEYLAAEYFKRIGYTVTVGPGRADGGKDVIAIRKDRVVGPEMILVQCKRYKEISQVAVDEVKAFYQTISDERATRGVFATTSRFAKGAKEYCDAREYHLKAADSAHVQEWIKEMKTLQTEGGTRIV